MRRQAVGGKTKQNRGEFVNCTQKNQAARNTLKLGERAFDMFGANGFYEISRWPAAPFPSKTREAIFSDARVINMC